MKTKKKVAIVTGSGKRLGKVIALALAEHGWNLVVCYYHSKKGAKEVVQRIVEMGKDAYTYKVDVSRKSNVQRLIAFTMARFGRIDLLVNNSAIFLENSFTDITESMWDNTLDINLKGTFLCSQAVAVQMLKQGGGKIINIASLGGIQPLKKHIPYSVSKAGVIMLTKCLARSLGPRITVNAIAPGMIVLEKKDPVIKTFSRKKILLKRYGIPSDVTNMVVFLAERAEYITGQVFQVDGGRSIDL